MVCSITRSEYPRLQERTIQIALKGKVWFNVFEFVKSLSVGVYLPSAYTPRKQPWSYDTTQCSVSQGFLDPFNMPVVGF